ncbi:helix-turn-helix domain-containing protein [Lactococcus garvieae]|uniref:Prophage ps1 protein 15 n=1 Tax=Lactococcus garvieae DCC43 TaxID=1231377 RepID=K2PPN0_9LACT|nr:helix-turn-helix transcriptional regulator [Lactococcus garvieae]EKF52249.1 prophage ps1 protein 15 [Lactococcus garvieae DCC43]
MTVYDRIKELADKKRVSLRQVAFDLGLGETYLYQLRKKTPNGANLEKLADYFNVSVDYLLGRSEAKPVNEPIDLAEVANSDDDDAIWETFLSAGGRPLTEKDKMGIKLLFADRWEEFRQTAKEHKEGKK